MVITNCAKNFASIISPKKRNGIVSGFPVMSEIQCYIVTVEEFVRV